MKPFTGALLVAASLLAAAPAHGQSLSLLDVPYLSQSEALCGGAAAAMVLRYWGRGGVSAEDFRPLVDATKGGIETSALARAVEERGFRAIAASGTPELARREVDAGRPFIALIQDRPQVFHYVVIVGWHPRAVALHDPARTPYVLMKPEEFSRRWQSSGNWMLAIAPVQSPSSESQFRVPVQSPGSESQFGVPTLNRDCGALVADGVRLAQQNDLAGAERLLANAAYQCAGAAPLRELAGVRLLQRRWQEARDLAERAVDIDAADTYAWRLLATARYVGGDPAGALDAWNRAGEPRVDIVSVSGLQRTSHYAVEQFLGIETGSVLRRSDMARASRRLAELPAAQMTRLEYIPRPAGAAEIRAHLVERSVLPRGRLPWTAIALRAAGSREIAVPVASLGRGGERLDASWRFWPNRPAADVSLHVPRRFGLLTIELASERQPFNLTDVPDAERLTTRGRVADWATGAVRWEMRGGFSRWRALGSFGTIGAGTRIERGRGELGVDVDGWIGDRRFATAMFRGGWRSSLARRALVLDLSGALATVSSGTPLELWPAGDTGHARSTLLRAHPVLDDGRLRVERLGQRLAQATAEAQYWWRAPAAVPVGVAFFVDAARLSDRPDRLQERSSRSDVDAGVGFRLALPGGTGLLRADVAHGLRDGRNALSLSWQP